MKLMGSVTPTRAAAGHAPAAVAASVADRPTFSLTLNLPIEWEMLDGPPDVALLDRLERSNVVVIGTLLKGVDLGAAPIEDEALAQALEPLRLKLDMVAEMVARLLYRDRLLPELRRIELGLNHILWSQNERLKPDTWLLNRIYFSDLFRDPVILAGRVRSCSPIPRDNRVDIEVDLAAVSEDLGESFARLAFLEHRRQLAQHAARNAAQRRR